MSELYLYELEPQGFELEDAIAGYYVSTQETNIVACKAFKPLALLRQQQLELRFVHNLWPVFDEVIDSSLDFSCIRMRNAIERSTSE